jgi:hypothetical protein
VILALRDAWKSYENFPKDGAAKAYVYLASQFSDTPINNADSSKPTVDNFDGGSQSKSSVGGMSKGVSTFQEIIGYLWNIIS